MNDLRLPLAAVHALRRKLAHAEACALRLLVNIRPPAWTQSELPLADADPFGELGAAAAVEDQVADSAAKSSKRIGQAPEPAERSSRRPASHDIEATAPRLADNQATPPSAPNASFTPDIAQASSGKQPKPQPPTIEAGNRDSAARQAALRDAVSRAFAPQTSAAGSAENQDAALTRSTARASGLAGQPKASGSSAGQDPPASRNAIGRPNAAPTTAATDPFGKPSPKTGPTPSFRGRETLTASVGLLATLTDELFAKTGQTSNLSGPKAGSTVQRTPKHSLARGQSNRSIEPAPGFTQSSQRSFTGPARTSTDGATPPQVNDWRAASSQGVLRSASAMNGSNAVDGETLADLLNDVLVDQARRQGVDV